MATHPFSCAICGEYFGKYSNIKTLESNPDVGIIRVEQEEFDDSLTVVCVRCCKIGAGK